MSEINPLRNPVEYQEKVLSLLKKYEVLLHDLYVVYAEKIPEHEKFWTEISQEETSHAYWIDTLEKSIGRGKVYFNEQRFAISPLEECIEEAEREISEAKSRSILMMEATSTSVNIENGIIERKFFEVFESDSPEIKKTFNMLKLATIEHANRVKEYWERERDVKHERGGIIHRIRKLLGLA